jgi:hypothetical protein
MRVGQGDLDDPDAGSVEPGEYIVTVVVNMPAQRDETVDESQPPRPGMRITAAKYASKDTSDLRATVKPGRNVVPLEVEAAPPGEIETPPEEKRGPPDESAPADDEKSDAEKSLTESETETAATPADPASNDSPATPPSDTKPVEPAEEPTK